MTCLWRIIKLEWRNERQTAGKVMIPNLNIPSPEAAHPSPAAQPNRPRQIGTNGNGWPTCCVSGVVKVFGKTPGLMLLHPFCAGTIIVVGQHMMIVSVQTCQYRTSTRTTHWRSNKAVFKLGSWNIRINELRKLSKYWKYLSFFASRYIYLLSSADFQKSPPNLSVLNSGFLNELSWVS